MNINKNTDFILDLDNLIDFIFDGEGSRSCDSEITETYVMDDEGKNMEFVNKQVREVKSDKDDSQKQTIKYDLVKSLLTVLSESEFNETGSLTLLESIALNTMLTKNLIKVVE